MIARLSWWCSNAEHEVDVSSTGACWGSWKACGRNRISVQDRTGMGPCPVFFFSMRGAGVGDLSIAKTQLFQLGQFCQMHHARVGDLGSTQVQPTELGQTLQVFQACIGDLGVGEM